MSAQEEMSKHHPSPGPGQEHESTPTANSHPAGPGLVTRPAGAQVPTRSREDKLRCQPTARSTPQTPTFLLPTRGVEMGWGRQCPLLKLRLPQEGGRVQPTFPGLYQLGREGAEQSAEGTENPHLGTGGEWGGGTGTHPGWPQAKAGGIQPLTFSSLSGKGK